MKNKLITIIFFVFFVIFWWLFFSDDYFQNIKYIYELEENKKITEKKVQNFKLENIKNIQKTDIFYTPNENLLNEIVKQINFSEEKIYISVYIFTEKRIKNALLKAKKRWVEVKIIMEKSPYMTNNINNNFFEIFEKNNIEVTWSNQDNYLLNHAKFLIIDERWIISTGNLSYSTFSQNRDVFVITKNREIINFLKKLFLNDFIWSKKIIYHENIVLSPNYSRKKINLLLENAKNEIKIYIPYINDKKITDKLIKLKQEKNISINILVSKNAEKNNNYKKLIKAWIKIKKLEKSNQHSKIILIDNKYIFISSINFSKQSFDENRELGIILKNKNIIKKFDKLFFSDLRH